MPSVQDLIDAAINVGKTREARIIEVEQAISAAQTRLREDTEADAARQTESAAILTFKDKAVNYEPDGDLEDLLNAADAVRAARGQRLIEVEQAVAAIAEAIREQSEADAASLDEVAVVTDFKQKANDYVIE